MRFKGKFHGISRDIDGNLIISFRVYDEKNMMSQLDSIKDIATLALEAIKPKTKRSLNANAFYWQLIGKLAGKLGISNARAHNIMLRRYGVVETFGGKRAEIFIPDTDEAEENALEADTYHIYPTSATVEYKDGVTRRMYVLLKGSSRYNSEEMSRLINGLVDDCKEQGIETLPQHEIDMMMEEARKREKHNRQ